MEQPLSVTTHPAWPYPFTCDPVQDPMVAEAGEFHLRVWFNHTIFTMHSTLEHTLYGYQIGDELVCGFDTIVPATEAGQPLALIAQVYGLLNRDDRPNGQTERSMSIGDVVELAAGPERAFWGLTKHGLERLDHDPLDR